MNAEQVEILLNVLGKSQETLSEFVNGIRLALTDRDENALRRILMNILEEQDDLEDAARGFFLTIRLILAGSKAVKSDEVPECVAIGNEQEGFFASGVLLTKR